MSRLTACGASAIRIGARIHACQKFRKINAPLGAGVELPTSTTGCYGNGFGLPAILHDHIRNDVEVKSMAGSVVL
jgi:hypothetical protein